MRIILAGALALSASALLGCSSPSVPSWARATIKDPYLAEKPLVERVPTKLSVVSEANDADAHGRKIDEAQLRNVKVDAPSSAASTLSPDDPRKALKELDQRQAEENRKIDAALAICHC